MELRGALRDLRTSLGATAVAVVSRDGLVVAADLPEGAYADTFAIMCATMLGAASTAHSELRAGMPERVIVESDETRTIILGAGRKALLVAVVHRGMDLQAAQRRMGELARTIALGT